MLSMAGKDRNDPPPATAFNTPAKNVATTSQTQCQSIVCQSIAAANPQKCMKRIVFEPTGFKLFRRNDLKPSVSSSNQTNLFRAGLRHRILSHMPALPFRRNPIAGLLVAALLVLLFALPGSLAAQTIVNVAPQQCVWHTGDNLAWAAPNLDESGWQPYTQWKPQYGQTHFWVRCHADLNALSSEADPEAQVSFYSAYTIYLDGQRIGGAGNLDSGIFNMDAIRSFPLGTAQIHSGASAIALRITGRFVLTNSGPVNALVSSPLELRVGNASILDAFRARAALTRSLQYLGSATCYAVIGVLAIMLIVLYLYDRSRYEFLQLSITLPLASHLAPERIGSCGLPAFFVSHLSQHRLRRESRSHPYSVSFFLCTGQAAYATNRLERDCYRHRAPNLRWIQRKLFRTYFKLVHSR